MRILIASRIDPEALTRLRSAHEVVYEVNPPQETLRRLVSDCEVLVFRSGVQINREVLSRAPDLRHLIRAGSGTDNVDLEFATGRGTTFDRIPEPASWAVSELALGLMLGLARKILWADRTMREGRWAKSEYDGCLLRGKTLGVVGLGNIGGRVGRLGVALGMRVTGCVEHPSKEREAIFASEGITLDDLATVVSTADFVSIHLPLTATTRGLIGAEKLAAMKPGSFLVNLSRGGIVDEGALRVLLRDGRLAGAGLDVHEVEREGHVSPLASLPNVILTPHVGSQVTECQRRIGARIVELIDEFAERGATSAPTNPGTHE